MFTNILKQEELEQIYESHLKEGKRFAYERIKVIVEKLFSKHFDTIRDLAIDTTVLNLFKLIKQKKELREGINQILKFSKDLNEKYEKPLMLGHRESCDRLASLIAEEIRKINERITAILQLYAGISALVVAIIAIFFSLFRNICV